MTGTDFRCSNAAYERADSMLATAPPAQRWLLLEHPGSWPIHALDAFGPDVAHLLARRAGEVAARVSLVRRPGRHPDTAGPYRWAFADVRPGHEGIRWGTVEHAVDVLGEQWHADPGEGDPVVLVCAHSKHDVCCATRGRPVAQVLAQTWPEQVWECSHLGGDRFAPTMVLLPHGLCYGRVDADAAAQVVKAYEDGQVVPGLLRGRCAYGRPEQAAQALARLAGYPGTGLDELAVLSSHQVPTDRAEPVWAVTLADEPALQVVLRERRVPLGTPATCRSTLLAVGYEYDLLAVGPPGAT